MAKKLFALGESFSKELTPTLYRLAHKTIPYGPKKIQLHKLGATFSVSTGNKHFFTQEAQFHHDFPN